VETLSSLAQRPDFVATSDPALREEDDRSPVHLLSYTELFDLWERQQWSTQDIDFTQDRIDWHERISPQEREQRLFGLSGFFLGEQLVTDELGPIMRAAPRSEQRLFLSTQIADEARHVRFFNRFYEEVGILGEAKGLAERLEATRARVGGAFEELFDRMLRSKVDRLAVEPEDTETLVEAVTLYHMVIEGALALTGQHFIIEYNESVGTLPGFVAGFQKVARDEHRHIAFGVRFLADMGAEDDRYRAAIQRTMAQALPIADGVLDPPWPEEEDYAAEFGTREETHGFAAKALSRRLRAIGLA